MKEVAACMHLHIITVFTLHSSTQITQLRRKEKKTNPIVNTAPESASVVLLRPQGSQHRPLTMGTEQQRTMRGRFASGRDRAFGSHDVLPPRRGRRWCRQQFQIQTTYPYFLGLTYTFIFLFSLFLYNYSSNYPNDEKGIYVRKGF
ncbi:hypothetical protein AAHE18_11G057600 [Arachis hypogaea]